MHAIKRIGTNRRLSEVVIHNNVAYIAGQVPSDGKADIAAQTRQVLNKLDHWLSAAGTDKSRLLTAQVFLADVNDFMAMNAVWEAWMPEGQAPARITVGAPLANPDFKVEIVASAAL